QSKLTKMATAATFGKLETKDKQRISKWIGRSKDLVLLYKATRDGMSPPIIHSKIDNMGPTVMVCWNTDGCVFGGYSSVNWFGDDEERFFYDGNAFLFHLKSQIKTQPGMYLVKNPPHALCYCSEICPRFGNVQFMDDEVTAADGNGVFVNAVKPVIGAAYQTGEKILLSKPWRPDLMSKVSKSQIKNSIKSYCPVEETGVRESRILFIGAVGSGKSSYVNTINSIFRGHVTCQAAAGSAEHSLTTMFRSYKIRDGSGFLKFRLCDTRGLEESQGVDPGDIVAMLDGNMPDLYTYNPSAAITPVTPGYIKLPSLNEKIHCVAFIIDGSSVELMNDAVLCQIKNVQNIIHQRGIAVPQVILLTKVDEIAQEVDEDLNNLFYSSEVEEVVTTVSQLVGLPRSHVLPVKNYEKETELNDTVDRYALLSLQQMLRFADDYLYNMLDTQV
ncbi:hypothetical protein LOTGIDRAFT_119204, partial [Lottia gigantea]